MEENEKENLKNDFKDLLNTCNGVKTSFSVANRSSCRTHSDWNGKYRKFELSDVQTVCGNIEDMLLLLEETGEAQEKATAADMKEKGLALCPAEFTKDNIELGSYVDALVPILDELMRAAMNEDKFGMNQSINKVRPFFTAVVALCDKHAEAVKNRGACYYKNHKGKIIEIVPADYIKQCTEIKKQASALNI